MHITRVFKKYSKSLAIIAIVSVVFGAVTGAIFRFALPQEYSSQMQILVIQKYTLTDSYTASKSAEKVSQNLAEVVKTSSFLEDVVTSNRVDLQSLLKKNESDRRKAWENTLETEVVANASILKIAAYDVNPAKAQQIVNAVADVLIEKGSEYHGAPDTISLKVVDTALTSTYPTRPNILLNSAAAAVFGAVCTAIVLFLRNPRGGQKNGDDQGMHGGAQEARHTVVTHRPGEPVHAQGNGGAHQPNYSVLHVANFQKHLPATQQTLNQPKE